MPRTYQLDLADLTDPVMLSVWTHNEGAVTEYLGMFRYTGKAYLASVKRIDDDHFIGVITTGEGVAAESGEQHRDDVDEKLNRSWIEYIKKQADELAIYEAKDMKE